jgi:uncharacterized membrane protein
MLALMLALLLAVVLVMGLLLLLVPVKALMLLTWSSREAFLYFVLPRGINLGIVEGFA